MMQKRETIVCVCVHVRGNATQSTIVNSQGEWLILAFALLFSSRTREFIECFYTNWRTYTTVQLCMPRSFPLSLFYWPRSKHYFLSDFGRCLYQFAHLHQSHCTIFVLLSVWFLKRNRQTKAYAREKYTQLRTSCRLGQWTDNRFFFFFISLAIAWTPKPQIMKLLSPGQKEPLSLQ